MTIIMKVFMLIVYLAVLIIPTYALLGRTQSAGVHGKLICNGKPAAGVKVKLYDDDRGIDTDDLMGETKTDSDGFFSVSGHTDEFTTIDPKFNIYHDCNDGVKPCQRKFTIKIPDSYVSDGKTPKKLYDGGVINLDGHPGDESRDCLN